MEYYYYYYYRIQINLNICSYSNKFLLFFILKSYKNTIIIKVLMFGFILALILIFFALHCISRSSLSADANFSTYAILLLHNIALWFLLLSSGPLGSSV